MPPRPRANVASLQPYTPGEQPSWIDTGRSERAVIKLNTNENPYPPSPRVCEAIANVPSEALRLYPPPTASPVRRIAGDLHGLDADHVLATNGGDELLRMLIHAYCEPGRDRVGLTDPTYSLYAVLAATQGVDITRVARDPGHLAPPSAADLATAWNHAGCTLAFLVNPHAPSGRLEPPAFLRELADAFEGLLVIDEAYVDFADADALPLLHDGRDDVVLLRSLSKGYGLAGLRVGYGLAHPGVIATLDKVRDSYNLDIIAQVAAAAALRDQAYASDTWQRVRVERSRVAGELRSRDWAVLPSATNFLLTAPPADRSAESIYQRLKDADVLVRYFNTPPLDRRLRISIGTPQQNSRLLELL